MSQKYCYARDPSPPRISLPQRLMAQPSENIVNYWLQLLQIRHLDCMFCPGREHEWN